MQHTNTILFAPTLFVQGMREQFVLTTKQHKQGADLNYNDNWSVNRIIKMQQMKIW